MIFIQTIVIGTGEITNEGIVVNDTYDPNMNNNYDYDVVIVGDNPNEPSVQTPIPKLADILIATGNPLIIVLLALISFNFKKKKLLLIREF